MSYINSGTTKQHTTLTLVEILEYMDPLERIEINKPDFMEPLKLFLDGLNKIGLTHELKPIMIEKVRQNASNRVAIQRTIRENPDVEQTEINPVVIVGLARSGTTMLQRLLASTSQFVSPMAWEVLSPYPPGRPEEWKGTERYQRAKDALSIMFPGDHTNFQHMHELKLEQPEECVLLLASYFLEVGLTMFPTMDGWKDYIFFPPLEYLRNAYKYYKKCLQSIYYNGLSDGKLPLLKSPMHSLYLDIYKETFPNAKFIFPYRNAKDMVGSCCSLLNIMTQMYGLDCDKSTIGDYALQIYNISSCRAIETLKSLPQEDYIAVSYSEMVKDPMPIMKKIYSHFGWDLTQEIIESMQSHLQESKHKQGEHKYSLEDFGITEQDLRESLSEYLDYFGQEENLL